MWDKANRRIARGPRHQDKYAQRTVRPSKSAITKTVRLCHVHKIQHRCQRCKRQLERSFYLIPVDYSINRSASMRQLTSELCICLNNYSLTQNHHKGTYPLCGGKKGADRDGRRPFLLAAIKPSAYLLTWPARTAAYLRSVALSRRLRRRMFLGVISTSSSSAMYSSASSSE